MKCRHCYEEVNLEADDPVVMEHLDIEETEVFGSVHLVLICSECAGDLKEATFKFNEDIIDQVQDHVDQEEAVLKDGHVLNISDLGVSPTEGKNKKGQPSYGVNWDYKITCSCRHYPVEGSLIDSVLLQDMDDLP